MRDVHKMVMIAHQDESERAWATLALAVAMTVWTETFLPQAQVNPAAATGGDAPSYLHFRGPCITTSDRSFPMHYWLHLLSEFWQLVFPIYKCKAPGSVAVASWQKYSHECHPWNGNRILPLTVAGGNKRK